MAVYRVDTLADDPQPVFDWIEANVPASEVVRTVAFDTVKGHYFKCVFRRQSDAEAFHRAWNPDAADFAVGPVGEGPTPTPKIPPGRRRARGL